MLMRATSTYKKIFFLLARPLLFLRTTFEKIFLAPNKFQKQGLIHFQANSFVNSKKAASFGQEICLLLDKIEKARQTNPEKNFKSYDGPDYSYEFINENQFYCERLGPRLRLTYKTNVFESWPTLAQEIINSPNYRNTLLQNFGTNAGVFKCYVEKTLAGGTEPQWHVDSISQIARLIFFLNPVSLDAAPMEYLTGSQLDSNKKYSSLKLQHLKSAESWTTFDTYSKDPNRVKLVGQKHESYLFDARGIHRSSLSLTSPRYTIMISFTPKKFTNWFFDLNRGGWPSGARRLNTTV